MHPTAKKILEAGGTVLKEPLTRADGEINPACIEQLDKWLEGEPIDADQQERLPEP